MATGGLNDKEISNVLNRFEESSFLEHSNFCNPCKFDNSDEIAIGFCIPCCEYLCKTCCRDHYKNKVTRNHVVLKDQDFPKDITPFLAIKELMKCSVHTYEEVTHECVDHSCFICVTCITEEHRQCDEVKKLASENSKDGNGFDLKKIASLQMKAMNCKLRSECNTLCKLVEKGTADIENREVKLKTIERIENINSDLQDKLRLLSNSEIHTISETTTQRKRIEVELNDLKNMTSIMSQHGSIAERVMVSKHVGKRVDDLVSEIECIEKSTILHGRTENPIDVQDPTIEFSSDDVLNEDLLNTSDKNNACCSSATSSYSDKGTQTDDTQRNIQKIQTVHQASNVKRPLIIRECFQETQYSIRTFTDIFMCDVLAFQHLSDGRFLLADHSNRKLKLFDKLFRLIREVSLPDCPTDICINQRGIFVCFSTSKFIHRYTIDGESQIYESTKFPTRYQAVSLDSYGEERIIILFLKGGDFDDTEADDVVIEIRNGSAIDDSLEFPDDDDEFEYVEDAKGICNISPSTFLLAEDERISCYFFDAKDEDQDKREWYYKSHGNKCLQKARGMCLDSEDNVYICGEDSNNVHQVSSRNYRESRVLIQNIREPVAVVMDECNDRLIVSCRNDDCVHVFSLK